MEGFKRGDLIYIPSTIIVTMISIILAPRLGHLTNSSPTADRDGSTALLVAIAVPGLSVLLPHHRLRIPPQHHTTPLRPLLGFPAPSPVLVCRV